MLKTIALYRRTYGGKVVRCLYVDQDVKETLRTSSWRGCPTVGKKIFNGLHIESAVAYIFVWNIDVCT